MPRCDLHRFGALGAIGQEVERIERDDDTREFSRQVQGEHVADKELRPCRHMRRKRPQLETGLLDHGLGKVNADDADPEIGQPERDAARAATDVQHRVGRAESPGIEGNVAGDALVEVGDDIVELQAEALPPVIFVLAHETLRLRPGKAGRG